MSTGDNASNAALEDETVHRERWRHYGLSFSDLYLLAGQNPLTNRFAIESGRERAGCLSVLGV